MLDAKRIRSRPIVYSRAEPDDEYDNPQLDPLDPYLIDRERDEIEDDDGLDEDEE